MTTTRILSVFLLFICLPVAPPPFAPSPFAPPHAQAQQPQPRRGIRLVRPAPPPSGAESPEERALRLLEARVDVVHRGNFLKGLDALGRAIGLKIEVGAAAAEDFDIDETTWVDWELRGCTARAALEHFLEQWGGVPSLAEWVAVDGRIVICYAAGENAPLQRRDLDVAGLVRAAGSGERARKALGEFPDVLTNIVEPTAWEKVGGNCRIERRGSGAVRTDRNPRRKAGYGCTSEGRREGGGGEIAGERDSVHGRKRGRARRPEEAGSRSTLPACRSSTFSAKSNGRSESPSTTTSGRSRRRESTRTGRSRSTARDLRASDALGRIFGEAAWMCLGGSLLVTGREGHLSRLSYGVFDVHDLVGSEADWRDVDPLVDAINTTIHPTTWDVVGGPGSMSPLHMEEHTFLVVSQTQEVLEEIRTLLEWIREARRKRHPVLRLESPQRGAILRALDSESPVAFRQDAPG